jgi:hypothetical protein
MFHPTGYSRTNIESNNSSNNGEITGLMIRKTPFVGTAASPFNSTAE